jgi:hypothetical protein
MLMILFQYLRMEMYEVLWSKSLLDISLATLETILQQDELETVTELDLFLACVRWSSTKERPREALGNALSLIRFRVFSVQDFARYVVPSKLLTDAEHTAIFCYLATKKGRMPEGFSNKIYSRDIEGDMEIVNLSWTQGKHFSPEEIATSPLLCFTVSDQAYIFGVKLYATREHELLKTNYYRESLELQLRNDEDVTIASASFHGRVEKNKLFTVIFQTPCAIYEENTYSLYIKFINLLEDCEFYRAHCKEQTYKIKSGLKITVQELQWNSIWGFIVAKMVR